MSTGTGTVGAQQRHDVILRALSQNGAVELEHLAATLEVSPMTVRRDLDLLESQGRLRRVRGGAVAASGPQPFAQRRAARSRAKRAVAAKAAALMPATGAVAMDASSTVGAIAEFVARPATVTLATNSYENFSALAAVEGATAVLIGGELEPATGSFVGKLACDAAGSLLYTRLFVSATAVDAVHGSSEVSLAEAQVKRAFAARAREIVLCVDSAKLGEQSIARGFALDEVTTMITELDPADPRLDPYRGRVELR